MALSLEQRKAAAAEALRQRGIIAPEKGPGEKWRRCNVCYMPLTTHATVGDRSIPHALLDREGSAVRGRFCPFADPPHLYFEYLERLE